jgi:hypothetical protein
MGAIAGGEAHCRLGIKPPRLDAGRLIGPDAVPFTSPSEQLEAIVRASAPSRRVIGRYFSRPSHRSLTATRRLVTADCIWRSVRFRPVSGARRSSRPDDRRAGRWTYSPQKIPILPLLMKLTSHYTSHMHRVAEGIPLNDTTTSVEWTTAG